MYDHYLQCNDTVLHRTKYKKYLICEIMHHQSVAKQLEYVTKDHTAMHTILF